MSIEIRNLSITSKVVQRQSASAGPADAAPGLDQADGSTPPPDWRIECRRMIQELLELQRER